MARGIGTGRPISRDTLPKPVVISPIITPQELVFFKPPKGVDVVTPLTSLDRAFSPFIQNLVLDRGVLRSRHGTETYHSNDAGTPIQLTTDLEGPGAAVATVARTTANQAGGAAGWTDPDGVSDGVNTVASVTSAQVPAASRLYNIVGDPTAGTNLPAYDSVYTLTLVVTASNTYTSQFASSIGYVEIEYSLDGGANWTSIGGRYQANANGPGSSQTLTFSPVVTISGVSSSLRLRLATTVNGVQAGGTGSATASVKVFNTVWLTDTYPVTWNTAIVPAKKISVRWTGTHLQTYDDPTDTAAAWTTAYTFPASQLNSDSLLPSFAIFGNTLVSTDIGSVPQVAPQIGSKGLISTLLSTPYATSILTHSPRAAHITVFGNRIVATRTNEWTAGTDPWVTSVLNPSRVRWCVKNNSNDWDGLGSGFEDLIIPGGQLDEAMGVFPVSDNTAIVVSERSIRRADVTNFFDAPFTFGLLTQSLGTLSRYAIKIVPGGVIFPISDDVIIFTLEGVKRIASVALRDSLSLITNPRLACGYYDQYNSRFLLAYDQAGVQVLWIYSFLDGGWTSISLPFRVVGIDRAFMTINGVLTYSVYYTQSVVSGFSCRENPTRFQDVDINGNSVDSPIEIRTGAIVLHPLRKAMISEVQLLYEEAASQNLIVDYSTNGGATWSNYSNKTVAVTVGPAVASFRAEIERTYPLLRLRSATLGGLKLISQHVFAAAGGLIRP